MDRKGRQRKNFHPLQMDIMAMVAAGPIQSQEPRTPPGLQARVPPLLFSLVRDYQAAGPETEQSRLGMGHQCSRQGSNMQCHNTIPTHPGFLNANITCCQHMQKTTRDLHISAESTYVSYVCSFTSSTLNHLLQNP